MSAAPEEPYDPHRGAEYVADEEEMYQAIYDALSGGSFDGEIRLDGRYYLVDLAGDDPVYEDDIPYNYTHNFFMCDDDHFADTHDLSMGKNRLVPKCSDLSRYYYVVDGSYMNGFDAGAMAGIILKHYDKEQAEAKFETEAVYKEALKGLGDTETSRVFVSAGIDISRISYCGTEGFIVKTIINHDGEK